MIDKVIDIASEAGRVILDFYQKQTAKVYTKPDQSPVTDADLAAHTLIADRLAKIYTAPVISEEDPPEFEARKDWDEYWLVDPLDGTKEFIARTGDFSVNIALVQNGVPTLGVILSPTTNNAYVAQKGEGCFFLADGKKTKLPARRETAPIVLCSRFHRSEKMDLFCKLNNFTDCRPTGASLKFGLLAEREGTIYPRFSGAYEWDIAAGQVIIEEANCKIYELATMKQPIYNKPDLRAYPFIVLADTIDIHSLKFPAPKSG